MKCTAVSVNLILLYTTIVVNGCATLKPEEQAYLEKVKLQPLTFTVSKQAATDMRGQAQVWISKYSTMKIQTVTDFVINTFNPGAGQFGYTVTFSPRNDSVDVSVECMALAAHEYDWNTPPKKINNEHIFAHYLVTGQLPYPHLISK